MPIGRAAHLSKPQGSSIIRCPVDAETQAVLFNAVPLLVVAALYLAVGLTLAPALLRDRERSRFVARRDGARLPGRGCRRRHRRHRGADRAGAARRPPVALARRDPARRRPRARAPPDLARPGRARVRRAPHTRGGGALVAARPRARVGRPAVARAPGRARHRERRPRPARRARRSVRARRREPLPRRRRGAVTRRGSSSRATGDATTRL